MNYKDLKIKTKFMLLIGIASIIVFSIMTTIIVNNVSEQELALANSNIEEMSFKYANQIDSKISTYKEQSELIAEMMSGYDSNDRDEVNAMLKIFLENNPDILGVYVAYEPDAFDGLDSEHMNIDKAHDSTGRFIPYWNRYANLDVEPLMDIETSNYYQLPKKTMQTQIIEPYLYNGKLLISFVSPIIKNGQFIGIAGLDIELNYLDNEISNIKFFDSGYAFMISNSGTFITHPAKKDWIGTTSLKDITEAGTPSRIMANDITKGKSGHIMDIATSTGKKHVTYYAPVETSKYGFIITVPIEEMEEGAIRIRNSMILISILSFCAFLAVVFFITLTITRPIKKTSDLLKEISEGDGDLTKRLPVNGKDEIGELSERFNTFIENIRQMILKISKNSETSASTAEELSASAEEVNASTEQVSTTIQDIAKGSQGLSKSASDTKTKADELIQSIKAVNVSAKEAANSSESANQEAKKGSGSAKQAGEKMNAIKDAVGSSASVVTELGEKSEQIYKVVEVINGISEQTNLLALNAAIEAARAGEAGRGFAVVADEVRKLAEESQKATKQIESMIKEIGESTKNAVESMNTGTKEVEEGGAVVSEALKSLENISQKVSEVTAQVQTIEAAANQQIQNAESVGTSIKEVTAIAEQSAAGSEEVSASVEETTSSMQQVANSAQELSKSADELKQLVSKFKV